jgi:tripartite-type tricarboxylate transporter receptor subunit TctC
MFTFAVRQRPQARLNLAGTSAFIALLAIPSTATPLAAADVYAGKTVELLVGAPPGGGYDIYARAVSRHLGRHIPGAPAIVVKNMPGAGSAKAAQYIATIAPKDGTSIAGIMPGAIMGPLLDDRMTALFNPTKVRYVGTANNGTRICVTLKGSKVATFADAQKIKVKFGGSAPNDSTFEYGYLHKHTGHTIWDIVPGYPGTADMALAMERGEIDGLCGWDWSSFKSQRPQWLREGKVNILLQASIEPNAELTKLGVPMASQFVKSDEDRKVLDLILSQTVFHRSYIAPPETPADRLEILRKAFDETMKDKAFLEDAEKARIDIDPLSGAKIQQVVDRLYATPPAIVDRARKAIRPD